MTDDVVKAFFWLLKKVYFSMENKKPCYRTTRISDSVDIRRNADCGFDPEPQTIPQVWNVDKVISRFSVLVLKNGVLILPSSVKNIKFIHIQITFLFLSHFLKLLLHLDYKNMMLYVLLVLHHLSIYSHYKVLGELVVLLLVFTLQTHQMLVIIF